MDFLSIALFAVTTCVTPGPNNVMLMSSGVNFGINRTMRHVIGINIGFPLMLVMVGLGIGGALREFPGSYTVLRVVSIFYLIYLAYGIATSPAVDLDDKSGTPLGVIKAALFQWVNPKAWVMCIGAVLAYADPTKNFFAQVLLVALIFFVLGTPCSLLWVFFGKFLRRFFKHPSTLRTFNVAMGLLLVGSLLPEILEFFKTVSLLQVKS